MTFEQFLPLIITVIAIALAWVLLRYLLRLTKRLFSCGCISIAALALFLLAMRYFEAV